VLAEGDEVGVAEFPQIAAQVGGQVGGQVGAQIGAHPQVPLTASPDLAAEAEAAPIAPLMLEPVAAGHPATVLAAAPTAALALLDGQGEVRPLDEIEAEMIRFAITHYRGQMSEVARRLQIGRSTLYRKLDTLGLVADTSEAESPGVASG
jgi:DNA-binding NtrC family response regulator